MKAIQINYLNAKNELIAAYRSADEYTAENLRVWGDRLNGPHPGAIWTGFELVPWQFTKTGA